MFQYWFNSSLLPRKVEKKAARLAELQKAAEEKKVEEESVKAEEEERRLAEEEKRLEEELPSNEELLLAGVPPPTDQVNSNCFRYIRYCLAKLSPNLVEQS